MKPILCDAPAVESKHDLISLPAPVGCRQCHSLAERVRELVADRDALADQLHMWHNWIATGQLRFSEKDLAEAARLLTPLGKTCIRR